jgi:hypothetical protein
MDRHFRPEASGPLITIRTGAFGGSSVYADGREVRPQRRGLRTIFPIPMPDGGEHPLRVHAGFGGLKAEFDGILYQLEQPLRIWEVIVAVLPIGLVAVGGAVGPTWRNACGRC